MRKCLVILLLLIFSVPVFSLEFTGGGTLLNSVVLEDDNLTESEITFNENLNLSGWFDLYNEGKEGFSFSLAGKGYIEIDGELVNGEEPTNHIPFLIDVEYLRLNMKKSGATTLGLTAGRLFFSDPARGMVISHTGDGIKLGLANSSVRMNLMGAYTGLVQNPQNDIRISAEDYDDALSPSDIILGPQRIYTQWDLTLLEVPPFKEYTFFAAGQFDLRQDTTKSRVHSQFLGFSHRKLHGRFLYENNYFIAQAVETLEAGGGGVNTSLGAMFGLNYDYYRLDWLNSKLSFNLHAGLPEVLIVGEIMDTGINIPIGLSGFLPVNKPGISSLLDVDYTNLAILETGYSFRPFSGSFNNTLSRLQLGVHVRGYFMLSDLGISWISTRNFASDFSDFSPYLGTELDWGINWRVVSDIGIGLTGTVFIPANGPGGAAHQDTSVISTVHLSLSMSF